MTRSVVPGPPPEPTRAERQALADVGRQLRRLPRRRWVPLLAIASEWAVIAACFVVAWWLPVWWVILPAAFLVACRQHGLLVLMHEAVHDQLHPRRVWNDGIADVLCAWPLYITTAGYRVSHLAHHRGLNTPTDPDWVMRHDLPEWDFPMPPLRLLATVGSLALGRGILSFVRSNRRMKRVSHGVMSHQQGALAPVGRLLFALGPLALGAWLGVLWLPLCLWVLPVLTLLGLLIRIRVIAEHYGLRADSVLTASRDWSGGRVLNWLFVPWGIRVHRTHHLYPGVPFHQLERAHRILAADPTLGPCCTMQGPGGLWADLTRSND